MGRRLDQTAKLVLVIGFLDKCINDTTTITRHEQNGNYGPNTDFNGIDKNIILGTVGAVVHSEEKTDRCQRPYRLRDHKVPLKTKIICYNCKKFGHIARYCPLIQRNEQEGHLHQQLPPQQSEGAVQISSDHRGASGRQKGGGPSLIDTTTLLSPKLTCGYSGSRTAIKAVDGTEVKCSGTRQR